MMQDTRSSSERATSELREMIFSGVLPPGSDHLETELADKLGMSRTPVREAALTLRAQGLVELRPRRGLRITPVSAQDMADIYDILTELESLAAARAAEARYSRADLATLAAAIKDMTAALAQDDLRAWAMADDRFHRELVRLGGNARLSMIVSVMRDQVRRARATTLFIRPKPTQSNDDHRNVYHAIARGDAKTAHDVHHAHRSPQHVGQPIGKTSVSRVVTGLARAPEMALAAPMTDKHILVAGAGIVGISCAIWLQRAGYSVTVVDRAGPASGTSHGNAGVLAAGAVVPVTVPGLMRKAPGMLFDRDAPLFLRWSYLPRLLPFLARYMGYATDAHVDHYSHAMGTLLMDSAAQHRALAAGTAAERFVSEEDYCFGYDTRADFEADAYGWGKRDAVGVRYEVVSGAAYAAFDPIYGDAFETVVRCKDHGRISDPGAYVKALADHFVEQGGTLHIAAITDITMADGQITALETADGPMRADHIVFALGPWSKRIAHKLGVKVPLESERGYHIELVNPSAMPRAAMMIAAGKFVITPMEGRIRAAGVVEFGGLEKGPSAAPFALLKRQVAALLPDVTYESVNEWMGHRPAPADSLPLIGANDPNGLSYSAFGHQHVGLTGGPKTGRLIADLIAGARPNIDLTPFDPSKHKAH